MFSSHKICSHVVAVAKTHSELKGLVDYHSGSHSDPNLTSLVMIGASISAGQKSLEVNQKMGNEKIRDYCEED